MKIKDLIILEYSPSQKAFNRQSLSDLIIRNRKAIATGQMPPSIKLKTLFALIINQIKNNNYEHRYYNHGRTHRTG
jgi:hypothetical protein